MLHSPFCAPELLQNSDDINLKCFERIKCNNLGKVPGTRYYSVNTSFPSFSSLQLRWKASSYPTPMTGPGLTAQKNGRSAQVRPRGGAQGCSSALYGSFSAPEAVSRQGLVRSGHGGAEVGKMAWRGWAQRGWGCGQAWAPPAGGRSCEELTAALASPRLLGRR